MASIAMVGDMTGKDKQTNKKAKRQTKGGAHEGQM